MLKQELKISQRQRLSPVQFQMIRMLGYSTPEMEEVVNKELEANPALEETHEPLPDEEQDDDSQLTPEQDDIDIMEADSLAPDTSQYTIKDNFSADRASKPQQGFASEESFEDSLTSQLDELDADKQTLDLAKYLVACLDDNGYLTRS